MIKAYYVHVILMRCTLYFMFSFYTERGGELVFYAILQPNKVIYGSQFQLLEELIIPGNEPATFR